MIRWTTPFCAELVALGYRVVRFHNRDAGYSTHLDSHPAVDFGALAAGLGISALPQSTLAMLGQVTLVSRPLTAPMISRTIGMAWLADRTLPPAASAFLQHVLARCPRLAVGLASSNDPKS